MKKYIMLANGEMIFHGDKIYAIILYNDVETHVEGRLCINEKDHAGTGRFYFICQNYFEGDDRAEDKFNKRFSWSFTLDDDGVLTSTDTIAISKHRLDEEEEEEPEYDGAGYTKDDRKIDDDDPMPDDWTPEEELPKDL